MSTFSFSSLIVFLALSSCALAEYFFSIKENFVRDPFGPDVLNCSSAGCTPIKGRSIFFYSRKRGIWYPQKPKAQRLLLTEDETDQVLKMRNNEIILLRGSVLCFNSDSHYSCSFVSAGTVSIPQACFQHSRFCSVSCPSTGETQIVEKETVSCFNLEWDLWWRSSCSKATRIFLYTISAIFLFVIIVFAIILIRFYCFTVVPVTTTDQSLPLDDSELIEEEEDKPKEKKPKRKSHKKSGAVVTFNLPLAMNLSLLFFGLVAHASTDTGAMTFDCTRINGTTDQCKVYFSQRVIMHSVGESKTLLLKDETGEEIQLHMHLSLEKTSYGLVHQYFTGEYKTAQASYIRCVGASQSDCKINPWQCTEHNTSDLSLRGNVELPYSWGKATCFVQPRSGCASAGHQGCYYASWAIGSNCSDDLYSFQAPSFISNVNVNGVDYRVGSSSQLDDFKIDFIGSFEGAMCNPGSSFNHLLYTSGGYYLVSATDANVGNAGQLGELQCDSSRKIARFYSAPTLATSAQDGHFYSFPEQAYQLQRSWKKTPFLEGHCLWAVEGSNLVGYSQSGSAVEIEISSYGKFSVFRQNVLCEPKIENLWLEGCSNCSSGRLICLDVSNEWGYCSSDLKMNFESSWTKLNVGPESQSFCIDVRNDTISKVNICLGANCIESEVSWELEDLVEKENRTDTDFRGKSTKWKATSVVGASSLLILLVIGIIIYVIIHVLQTRKIKLQ